MLYKVIKEETCPECNGVGYVPHPIYAALASATEEYESLDHTKPISPRELHDFQNSWMADQGYPGDNWPAWEYECDCDRGMLKTEVDLREALKDLGIYRGLNVASCLANGIIPD